MPTPLDTLRDYVERSTHWQEGGATRHDAKLALKELDSQTAAAAVGSITKTCTEHTARAALRRVLQHHKVTVHGDGVLEADIFAALGVGAVAEPVGSICKTHLKPQPGPWCKELLMYSPDNQGDTPSDRVMLYTAGRLGDALEWAEKGLAEWRAQAQANARHTEMARATARIAIAHLQAVLNQCRSAAEQQAADTAARDWLTSIGSEPG